MIAKGISLTSHSEQACQEAASEINCQHVASNVGNLAGCK
jgi:hypothetical protein